MPNINLVQTISTSTSNRSYFVMSDNGLVRRFKVEDFVTELQQEILDVARTDQNLFKTSDVIFKSVSLLDRATVSNSGETEHGLSSNAYHGSGTAIQQLDLIGSYRFGGYDGRNNTILDNAISTAGINAIATENWNYSGSTSTNAGTGLIFYHQPVNTQLSTSSRVSFLSVYSVPSITTATPSISVMKLGTVQQSAYNTLISADSSATFSTHGRTDISVINSRMYQVGIPAEDTSTVNLSWLGTNAYTFVSGRSHTFSGYTQPIKQGDTLGSIVFKGITTSSNNQGVLTALIRAHATTDYSTSTQGSGMHFRTVSSSTSQLVTCLDIQPEGNIYASDYHRFVDSTYQNSLTIREGFIYFNDGSAQNTAYPGFTSVPAHSTSTGSIGQIAHDTDYIYLCIEQNRWKRILALDF